MGFPGDWDGKEFAWSAGNLGGEDPLEEGMPIHSSIPAWSIPWTEELVGCSPWSCKELDTTKQLTLSLHSHNSILKIITNNII